MLKSSLFVLDWKPEECYNPISDIVDLEISSEVPDTIDRFSGIILHSYAFAVIENMIKEAKKFNLPLILQTGNKKLVQANKDFLEDNNLMYNNVCYVRSYDDLFVKVREIFG